MTERVAAMGLKYLALIIVLASTNTLLSHTKISEDDIRVSIEQFGAAFINGDIKIIENLVCNNYTHINGNSGNIVQKNEWLKWFSSRRPSLDNRELIIKNYEIKDLQIKIFGDSAVVVGEVKSSGLKKDIPFQSHLRFTNVWIIENEKLCRTSFHDSEIK